MAKPNKYRNVQQVVGGQVFDSKGEAARWQRLQLLERAGVIRDLKRQQLYVLMPGFRDTRGKAWQQTVLIVDFEYLVNATGRLMAEDFKGRETEVSRLKRKLFAQRYPGIELRIVKDPEEAAG